MFLEKTGHIREIITFRYLRNVICKKKKKKNRFDVTPEVRSKEVIR